MELELNFWSRRSSKCTTVSGQTRLCAAPDSSSKVYACPLRGSQLSPRTCIFYSVDPFPASLHLVVLPTASGKEHCARDFTSAPIAHCIVLWRCPTGFSTEAVRSHSGFGVVGEPRRASLPCSQREVINCAKHVHVWTSLEVRVSIPGAAVDSGYRFSDSCGNLRRIAPHLPAPCMPMCPEPLLESTGLD